ncbi:MAG TPA: hypothetical protein VFW33_03110 [Gemmataceae bacterium]|nr:hypothetical protein [Gemmataceae bacterium]
MRRLIKKPTSASPAPQEREFAPPLFKNSLLAWQARWKAQRGAAPSSAPRPSVPARPA